MTTPSNESLEPNPVQAIWRSRWLVVASAIVATALGIAYASLSAPSYESTVSLVIENPAEAAFAGAVVDIRDERYVADQVEVILSGNVAENAAELLLENDPPIERSPRSIENAVSVRSTSDSNVVTIKFTAGSPEVAEAAVVAVAAGYEDLVRAEVAETLSRELAQIDSALATLDEETDAIQAAIERNRLESEAADELGRQFDAAVADYRSLVREPVTEQTRQALTDLAQRLQLLSLLQENASAQPELAPLIRQLEDTFRLRSELTTRRIEAQLAAQLASSGASLVTPPTEAIEVKPPLGSTAIASAILGMMLGAALGYYRAVRRPTFTDRSQPELILKAPLVGDVPLFAGERINSELPVRDAPASVSADSFLFISTAIDVMGDNTRTAPAGGSERRIVGVVSSVFGEGKSVVAANTALAAARGGRRVLLVDCNFEDEQIADLLFARSERPAHGLPDIIQESLKSDLNWSVISPAAEGLDFIGRGAKQADGPTLFQSQEVGAFFAWARTAYDLVLLAVPPITQAPWAGAILRHADAALAVIRHGSKVSAASELSERLGFLGVPLLGYAYNMAPFRTEMVRWQRQRLRDTEQLTQDVPLPLGPAASQ